MLAHADTRVYRHTDTEAHISTRSDRQAKPTCYYVQIDTYARTKARTNLHKSAQRTHKRLLWDGQPFKLVLVCEDPLPFVQPVLLQCDRKAVHFLHTDTRGTFL